MPKYKVAAGRQTVNKFNDAGTKILKRTRYHKGDVVELPEEDAYRLVETGGLVPLGEDGQEEPTPDLSVPPAAVSGQTAEQSLRAGVPDATDTGESEVPDEDDPKGASDLTEAGGTGTGPQGTVPDNTSVLDETDDGDDGDGSEGDELDLDNMSYPDVQAEAKKRDIAANQSMVELVAAIKAHDEAADDGDDS